MAFTGRLSSEYARQVLSEAIRREIGSWPDLHRRVFVRSHYEGQSTKTIAISLGLSTCSAELILEECEQKLLMSLRRFRENDGDYSKPGTHTFGLATTIF